MLRYTQPIVLNTERENKILYRSVDRAGNEEAPKELEIKIDTTPPEISLQFDLQAKQLKGNGADSLSGIHQIVQDTEQITVLDIAGNVTKLNMKSNNEKNNKISVNITNYSSNGKQIIIPLTQLKVNWHSNTYDEFKDLTQVFEIKKQEKLSARFKGKKDKTTLVEKQFGEKKEKLMIDGLVLLKLRSNKDGLTLIFNFLYNKTIAVITRNHIRTSIVNIAKL